MFQGHCSRIEEGRDFPGGAVVKEPSGQCRRLKRHGFDPWVRKIPWKRKWQPTPVSLPGESRGQRSLEGYSPWGRKERDTTEPACTCVHGGRETLSSASCVLWGLIFPTGVNAPTLWAGQVWAPGGPWNTSCASTSWAGNTGHRQDEARRAVARGAGQSARGARGCTVTGQNSGKGPEEEEVRMSGAAMQELSACRGRQQTCGCQRGRGWDELQDWD